MIKFNNKLVLLISSLLMIGCTFDSTGLGDSTEGTTSDTQTETSVSNDTEMDYPKNDLGNDSTTSTTSIIEETTTSGNLTTSTSGISSTTDISSSSSTTGIIPAECGNNIIDEFEECDDGPEGSIKCDSDCTKVECGDNVHNPHIEECDDGNTIDDDGCSNSCVLPRKVFISEKLFNGDEIGGIPDADEECNLLAANSGLLGKYKSWVSYTTGYQELQVSSRFESKDFNGWYQLINGTPIANGWEDLIQNGPLEPILLTNENNTVEDTGNVFVWTGTTNKGNWQIGQSDCNFWGAMPKNELWGKIGNAAFTDYWSDDEINIVIKCEEFARIYCFEVDPNLL